MPVSVLAFRTIQRNIFRFILHIFQYQHIPRIMMAKCGIPHLFSSSDSHCVSGSIPGNSDPNCKANCARQHQPRKIGPQAEDG